MLDKPVKSEGLVYVSRASKKARRAGSIAPDGFLEQRWAQMAERSIERYEDAGYGKRGSVLDALSAELGVKPSYLRNALAAYKFAVSGVIDGVNLLSFPIGTVDDVKRWSEVDVEAATLAIMAVATGRLDLDEFTERAARLREMENAAEPAYRAATAFRSQARDIAQSKFDGFELCRDAGGVGENHITLQAVEGSERVVIVTMGPYDGADRELQRCRDALVHALGLLLSFERVVLACATAGLTEHARSLLAQMPRAGGLAFRNRAFDDRFQIWGPEVVAPVQTTTQADGEAAQAPLLKQAARRSDKRPKRDGGVSASLARKRSVRAELKTKKRAG